MRAAAGRTTLVHTKVPGRARLHVPPLARNEDLRRRIEVALRGRPGVLALSASIWTGNVLVRFGPERSLGEVVAWLDELAAPQAEATPLALRGQDDEPPPHGLPVEAILARHATSSEQGLSTTEARRRLALDGPNALPSGGVRSELQILLAQFATFPVALLGGSAVLSVLTGGLADAIAIAGVVGLNALIGFASERSTERTVAALKRGGPHTCPVVRDGRRQEVPVAELVAGDLLLLAPGRPVGADARVVACSGLSIDEAVLTGESLPVRKSPAVVDDVRAPLGERRNMVHQGTSVFAGHGRAIVVATGARSEIGRIQVLLEREAAPLTPMQRQLNAFGQQLVLGFCAVCGLVFALGLARGYGLLPMVKTSVSLAVAAIPEGLPAIATSTLALGVGVMRRQGVLIRKIEAIETLGAVQTLCFDKTGTLTQNRMSVVQIATDGIHRMGAGDGTGSAPAMRPDYRRLFEIAVLCNQTRLGGEGAEAALDGSPTERALVELGIAAGVDVATLRAAHPVLEMRDRHDARPYMVSVHQKHGQGQGQVLVALKGNPAAVLALARRRLVGAEVRRLDEDDRRAVHGLNEAMAGEGLRVLGFAYALGPDEARAMESGPVWVGLAGLADPVRPGMRELVETLHRAGTETVMITGDQSATAYAIARQLKLTPSDQIQILDARDLDQLDAAALTALAPRAHVFSRVSPRHKLLIVRALQQAGKVVAMTGDGVNDGPALKVADVGIAMGRDGTDLARDVADIVLEDDELASVVTAVGYGRGTYANIRKAIRYLIATNTSEIGVALVCTGLALPQPLSPIQLLWLNLASDVLPAIALAVDPPDPDLLQRPPRDASEPLLGRDALGRLFREGAVMTGGALAAYAYGLRRFGPGPAARTLVLVDLVVAQLMHAFCCRSDRPAGAFRQDLPANPKLTAAVAGTIALQAGALFVPGLRRLLGAAALAPADVVVGAGLGLGSYAINEAWKGARPPAPDRRADAGES